jgi:anaerobic selenocysteine-containing dehydrogenase
LPVLLESELFGSFFERIAEAAMEFSRRTFIKAGLNGGAGLSALGFDPVPVYAQTQSLKIARATETHSTCPNCSVSCGVII